MMRRYYLLPGAEDDLYEHSFYLVENAGPEVAARFSNSFFASVKRLTESPLIGVERNYSLTDLKDIRLWFVRDFEDYLIFYRVTDTAIEVVRVLHSSQDVENIISSDSVS
jgi:toxin ParE1/3/4